MGFKYFIGIDVGNSELFEARIDTKAACSSQAVCHKNNDEGIKGLLERLGKLGCKRSSVLVLIENTGSYCERVTASLGKAGFYVWLAAPNILEKGLLKLNRLKDDPHDARMLAMAARTHQAEAVKWQPGHPDVEELRDLQQRRDQIVEDRKRKLNQLHAQNSRLAPNALTIKQLKAGIEADNAMEKEVKDCIKALEKTSETIRKQLKSLKSIPGIGQQNAIHIIISTKGFTKFKHHKQFAAHVCTAPYARSSGSSGSKVRRTSKKGDRKAKARLYMAILATTTRKKGFWKDDYLRYIGQGKHHLMAINNIINKVIKLVFTIAPKGKTFDKDLYLKNRGLSTKKNLTSS